MSLFGNYNQAVKAMPRCLVGEIDDDAIALEATANADPPLAVLRDLVRVECDLIDEGHDATEHYTPREVAAVRRYLQRLGG